MGWAENGPSKLTTDQIKTPFASFLQIVDCFRLRNYVPCEKQREAATDGCMFYLIRYHHKSSRTGSRPSALDIPKIRPPRRQPYVKPTEFPSESINSKKIYVIALKCIREPINYAQSRIKQFPSSRADKMIHRSSVKRNNRQFGKQRKQQFVHCEQ